jgi:hypothetical protein
MDGVMDGVMDRVMDRLMDRLDGIMNRLMDRMPEHVTDNKTPSVSRAIKADAMRGNLPRQTTTDDDLDAAAADNKCFILFRQARTCASAYMR